MASPTSSTASGTHPSADAILESLTDGVLVFDAAWRFTYLNAAGERVLGRARAELLGRVLWDELPELASTPFGQAYRRAMADRTSATIEGYYPPTCTGSRRSTCTTPSRPILRRRSRSSSTRGPRGGSPSGTWSPRSRRAGASSAC